MSLHYRLKNSIIYPIIHTSYKHVCVFCPKTELFDNVKIQHQIIMLKVIHDSSHSERVRLYIMYLSQISLKKIDIPHKKMGDTVLTMTSKISLPINIYARL